MRTKKEVLDELNGYRSQLIEMTRPKFTRIMNGLGHACTAKAQELQQLVDSLEEELKEIVG